jgi:glycerol dehydrogenase-like iron-containing ADH family enzyme
MIGISEEHSLISTAEKLLATGTVTISDGSRDLMVIMGDGVLSQRLHALESFRLLSDQKNRSILDNPQIFAEKNLHKIKSKATTVISLGSFPVHNRAKGQQGHLIVVPVPLTNDSFCTNRCNHPNRVDSYPCQSPDEILIDLEILKAVDLQYNLLGWGEFISLYYSILDYSFSRKLRIPADLLFYISRLGTKLLGLHTMSDYDALLRHLSAGLILKCCVMYTALDHEIGCGGDHMIGNFLEKRYKLPHGQAVFYGAVLMAMLFPEWAKFGLSEEDLLKSGLNTSLLDLEVFKNNSTDI